MNKKEQRRRMLNKDSGRCPDFNYLRNLHFSAELQRRNQLKNMSKEGRVGARKGDNKFKLIKE
jgi:hypothetical protein